MGKNKEYCPDKGDALIIVDVQKDFLEGGSLAVSDGEAVIPVLNEYINIFEASFLPIFASRDWHPPNHSSFTEYGGPWPPHCIAGTPGADFPVELSLPKDAIIISKATTPEKEDYSGLDNTVLDARLKDMGVDRVFVGGLATDYCVLNTVKDFLAADYKVLLLEDAIRAVNVKPGDGSRAVNEMTDLGAINITLDRLK